MANQLSPLTIVSVSQGLSRYKEFTWAGLGFTIGAKSPELAKIKAALEAGDTYDMGEGVYISTKFAVSPHHKH